MKDSINFQEPSINLNGKYKIQLFDKDTGEMVQEVEKHNVISKIPFSSAFYNHIYSGFILNTNNTGCGISNTSDYTNYLLLTSDPESPENDCKNPVILGEVIGYAEYGDTDSGSNLKRGVFNKNETTKINNHYQNGSRIKSVTKHIVFDFPTDKGNGTFDNIYLAPFPSTSYPNDYRGERVYFDTIRVSNDGNYEFKNGRELNGDAGVISSTEKYLYMQCLYYNGKKNKQHWDKAAQIDLETWEIKYITLNVPSENSSNPAYIIYACGMFWRIEANYNTTRYNLDGTYKDSIDIKKKINSNILNLDGTKDHIGDNCECYSFNYFDHFTGDDNNLYLSYILKNTNKDSKVMYETHICTLDSKSNLVSDALIQTKDNEKPDNTIPINIAYINNKKYIITSELYDMKNKVFTCENGILNEKCSEILIKLSRIGRQFFYSKNGFLFITGGTSQWNGSILVYTLLPWSSHCKLSSPVTKTSANTMKIQYDVTVDYITPGMISNLK